MEVKGGGCCSIEEIVIYGHLVQKRKGKNPEGKRAAGRPVYTSSRVGFLTLRGKKGWEKGKKRGIFTAQSIEGSSRRGGRVGVFQGLVLVLRYHLEKGGGRP